MGQMNLANKKPAFNLIALGEDQRKKLATCKMSKCQKPSLLFTSDFDYFNFSNFYHFYH